METLDGIVHLVHWLAERRGKPADSAGDRLVQEPALAPLLPLLYYCVPDSVLPLSPAARERCARAYYHTLASNLLIYQELSRLLAALATTDSCSNSDFGSGSSQSAICNSPSPIPAVVLKGAALAVTLYPSIGLRPMGDIDLLVPKDRLDQAVAVVRALGYVPKGPEIRPGLTQVIRHEVNFDSGEHIPLCVELHWNLIGSETSRYRPRIDWFWEQTEQWKLEGGEWKVESGRGKQEREAQSPPSVFPLSSSSPQPQTSGGQFEIRNPEPVVSEVEPSEILTLTPTAHLLYLAAHTMLQHGGARASLIWFCDLDLLIRRQADRLDWDELLRRAREFRWAAALLAALQGAQERLGTPLPQGFLEVLVEAEDRQAARLVERKADPRQTRATRVWNFLSPLDWQARLRLLLAIVFPTPAYVRWRYKPWPGWLWPLCYPYRWLDILREGLTTLWRMAKQRSWVA